MVRDPTIQRRVLTARYVVPVDRPPIEDGGVCVERGRITAVAPRADLPAAPSEDLGDAVLLPGLINAHAHLNLSCYGGRLKPSGFWVWLPRLMRLKIKGDRQQERAAAVRAASESLRAGVTCIADLSREVEVFAGLRDVPVRKVCFPELISVASDPPRNPDELMSVVDAIAVDDRLTAGVSPHAPYTVSAEHLAAAAELAGARGLPLTVHWAETKEECRWLARGGGVLGAVIRGLSAAGTIRPPRCESIEYAQRLGLLSTGALLVHVNYLSDEGLARLRQTPASVAFCPRSHRFFGHKHHRWRDMLEAGVNVCLGTDSSASLPPGAGLSVIEDMRLLHREHPDVPPATLVAMATANGARALGLGRRLGTLTPGKQADLTAFPLADPQTPDPLADVLRGDAEPIGVWVDGERHVP